MTNGQGTGNRQLNSRLAEENEKRTTERNTQDEKGPESVIKLVELLVDGYKIQANKNVRYKEK